MNNQHQKSIVFMSGFLSLIVLIISLYPALSFGADLNIVTSNPKFANYGVLKMILSLGIVITVILGASKAVKHFKGKFINTSNQMQIISMIGISSREKIMLIEVKNTHLLLNNGAKGVQVLHVFEEKMTDENSIEKVINKQSYQVVSQQGAL